MSSEKFIAVINSLWMSDLTKIIIYFLLAWIVSLLAKKIAHRLMKKEGSGRSPSVKRKNTLQSLLASAISLLSFLTAILLSLGLFVEADTLIWMVGLFSAAFGLGARPLIGDYLAGISFIFEDTFTVEEKVEIPGLIPIEGLIEAISLRTTSIRANSGELYVVPNGEIRTVRNFSRGKFSLANIIIKINSHDLNKALLILENLGSEAMTLLPNLLERWMVVSESGVIGHETELTVIAKARFGKASEMRPRLLALVQERLLKENIPLVS
ncbi:MAG: mechanosensitive ion channel [Anaerolineae bacterium]|jgi:moderate conductance mechanosensitive channel|nr:mechanosensitive ion channel [Anaerolineae bacterium]MBT7326827.1 mechanosensitive ion channel [Anaerolineae bacterium]